MLGRCLDNPKTTLAIAGAYFLLCCITVLGMKADRATDSFLPRGHASFEDKKEIQRIYNINDPLLVDVFATEGDIFTPEGLRILRKVSRFVEEMPGVRSGSVRSLDTHDDIVSTEDGFDVKPFLEPFPTTALEAGAIRDRVMVFPVYVGLIVSEDGTRAGVVADFTDGADVLATFSTLDNLGTEIEEISGGRFRIAVTGPPIVTGTLNVYLNQDALTLNPVSAALTSLLLFVCLRSLAGVFLPLTVMLPSVGAGFAAMTWLGYTFNPFSNAVPVVILATSIADSVHIISAYYDRRVANPGGDRRACLIRALDNLWIPITFTSATTACGFLLLGYSSPMLPVQQFGVTVAVGVMAAMVYSLTVLPCVMLLLKVEPTESFRRAFAAGTQVRTNTWSRFVDGFVRVVVTSRVWATSFVVMVLGIIAISLPRVYSDYEPVKFFPQQSAVYQDYYSTAENYVGVNFIEIDIVTNIESGVYEPDFLQRLEGLQRDVEDWDVVGGTIALTDYLKKMHEAFNGGRRDFHALPDRADLNAQYFLLYNISGNPRRFDELTDERRSRVNFRIFLKTGRYARTAAFVEWLEAELAERFPNQEIRIGGEAYVVHNWMDTIFQQVLSSIGLTLACMFVIGLVLIRSVFASVMMLLPVAAGVGLTYAYIGLTGIPVGLGTSIFASIAIGVGIDFAIHYLWSYRRWRRLLGDHAAAVRGVMESVGKVILFNALIVAGGFSVLLLSTTTPPAQVGTFVAISIAASLATTFLLLGTGARFWRVEVESHQERGIR